ncbi:unknown [[Mannheimia] succiniciproducens MBEL55E]|uniref:Uncharacterized protein n=1 Tax=Mannheimia succiniciproducens (strain KCTC 0769BP / MBEL55E) TaxID=221988 RepID=Q65W38_MANSM|nr:unknown [[Mannheimia] succiniciproducens MBEL55E]
MFIYAGHKTKSAVQNFQIFDRTFIPPFVRLYPLH